MDRECVVQERDGGWNNRMVVVMPVSSRLLNAVRVKAQTHM